MSSCTVEQDVWYLVRTSFTGDWLYGIWFKPTFQGAGCLVYGSNRLYRGFSNIWFEPALQGTSCLVFGLN